MAIKRIIRLATLGLLTPACLFQLGGCFSPETLFTAAATTLGLTAAAGAQNLLAGALSTLLGG